MMTLPFCTSKEWALRCWHPWLQVFLASVDQFGNLDPAPGLVPVTTAPGTGGPALLPGSGPANVTATSFGLSLRTDAAGGVYYYVLAAKPGAGVQEPDVAAGNWAALPALPRTGGGGGQRRLFGAEELSFGFASAPAAASRELLADAVGPGALVLPTCYPANLSCQAAPAAVFARAPGLAAFNVVASGCAAVPAAGQAVSLPPSTGLQNNTLYYVLLAAEDSAVPTPNVQPQPAVFAVRRAQGPLGAPCRIGLLPAGLDLPAG